MSNKVAVFIIGVIVLIFLLISVSFADETEKSQGYVQITANVDDTLKKYNANVVVGINEIKEDGYSEIIYLYSINNYTTIVTLPEGLYEISYAKIDGDEDNVFWFSANDTDFVIDKDNSARMYFSLGNTVTTQKNIDNQENDEDDYYHTPSPEEMEVYEEMGLADCYNEDGTLNAEKVKEKYEKNTGETIEETIVDKDEEEIKKEKKEKEMKNKREKIRLIFNIILIIAFIGVSIMFGIYKIRQF